MGAYLSLTITDLPDTGRTGGLAGFPLGTATRTVWCHLPAEWVVDGVLRPCRRQILVDQLRRSAAGPADADRHVLLEVRERLLSEREARDRPWLGDRADFRRFAPDGSHQHVPPDQL